MATGFYDQPSPERPLRPAGMPTLRRWLRARGIPLDRALLELGVPYLPAEAAKAEGAAIEDYYLRFGELVGVAGEELLKPFYSHSQPPMSPRSQLPAY